jgi:hypothetical protein
MTRLRGHSAPNSRKNAAETAREREKKYVTLRSAHSAVESDITGLEHHGLSRCRDVGWEGYWRYAGLGVLSYNLHVIGRQPQTRQRVRAQPLRLAA